MRSGHLRDLVKIAGGAVRIELRLQVDGESLAWMEMTDDIEDLLTCSAGWTYALVVQETEPRLRGQLVDHFGLGNGALPEGVTFRALLPDEAL